MNKVKRVTYKKLRKNYGLAIGNTIEIDSRIRGKKLLEILIHESLHVVSPQLTEEQVTGYAAEITRVLWKEGFRKADNEESIPLQDGKP